MGALAKMAKQFTTSGLGQNGMLCFLHKVNNLEYNTGFKVNGSPLIQDYQIVQQTNKHYGITPNKGNAQWCHMESK